MARLANLAGVAHNIAHHSGSCFGYLSPHLGLALRAAGADTTTIELLDLNPYPPRIPELEPLRMALTVLHLKVEELLLKHGFTKADVTSVELHASPAPWDKSGQLLHTRAVVVGSNGRVYDSGWLQ
jgi:hypothetical protein